MRILFVVDGEGLEHTSRCVNLGYYLHQQCGHSIHYLAYGESYDFIHKQQFANLHHGQREFCITVEDGLVSLKKTLWCSRGIIFNIVKSILRVRQVIQREQIDVVICDTMFGGVLAARLLHVPVVFMTDPDCFICLGSPSNPFWKIPNFLIRCYLHLADAIIVPDYPPPDTVSEYNIVIPKSEEHRYHFTGPFLDFDPYRYLFSRQSIFIRLGGESYNLPLYRLLRKIADKRLDLLFDVFCTGPTLPDSSGNFLVHGYVPNLHEHLAVAQIAIVSGDLTSLHETLLFEKPVLIITDPHHPEQQNNAKKIVDMGAGIAVDGTMVSQGVLEQKIIKTQALVPKSFLNKPAAINGRKNAAAVIESAAESARANILPTSDSQKSDDPWSSLWLYRFLEYFVLFVFVVILGKVIINGFDLVPTDLDSAKYFLSSMLQAQATIVALVITLTLIAIQMTAGSYTPRVVDVMIKNPDMWFLLVIYIASISFGFFALKIVNYLDLVSFILILGIYTFLTLFPYMINTIKLLRPEEVVIMLVGDINAGNIELKESKKEWENDIMQPVFDVVHVSINRFDISTTKAGLNQLSKRILKILPNFDNDDDARKKITDHFCKHMVHSSLIALRHEDERIIDLILNVLNKFNFGMCEYKYERSALLVIWAIESIGIDIVNKKLKNATICVIESLGNAGADAADNKLEKATVQVVEALENMGILVADNTLENSIDQIVLALEKIGEHAAFSKLEKSTVQVASILEKIGKQAADNNLKNRIVQVAEVLEKIGIQAADNKLEDATLRVIVALETIGKQAACNNLANSTDQVVVAIKKIGEHATHNKQENVTLRVIVALETIGKQVADNKLENTTIQLIIALDTIGMQAYYENMTKALDQVIVTIKAINDIAIKNELKNAAAQVSQILKKFEDLFKKRINPFGWS